MPSSPPPHYLGLAERLTNDVDQVGWDTQWVALRPELGNFRAALDWAVDDVASIDDGLRLLTRLWDLWIADGHHQEALERADALLGRDAGSAPARSAAAYAAGLIAEDLGTWDRSLQLLTQALAEAHAGGDRVGEARVRRFLCLGGVRARTNSPRLGITPKPPSQLSIETDNPVSTLIA